MSTLDDELTTDEIYDLDDDLEKEDDDPLFGNLKNNEGLKLLLSPTKKKKKKKEELDLADGAVKRKVVFDEEDDNKKRLTRQPTICSYFNNDPLDKELGFSLKKTMEDPMKALAKSRNYVKLKNDIERNRQIAKILEEKETEEKNQEKLSMDIENWITSHVNENFLNSKSYETKVHANWVSQLRLTVKDIIYNNNQTFNEEVIDKEILKLPQYNAFKCFTNQGTYNKQIKNIDFLFNDFSLKNLVESIDINYVESFHDEMDPLAIDESVDSTTKVLEELGFATNLISHNPIELKFDDKRNLPPIGCGFQVFKFVKSIEMCPQIFSKREIISALILMIVDNNVNNDIRKFRYRSGDYTGKQIAIRKLKEYKEDVKWINEISKVLFVENCHHLWYQLIRNIRIENEKSDILFGNKLILEFLNEIRLEDDYIISENFEDYDNSEDLFTLFESYLNIMSYENITSEDEDFLPSILLKIELINIMFIINNETIRALNVEENERFNTLGRSIHTIKNSYFKGFQNSFNPNVPKCKKILDFIYHELSAAEFGDFFAD